MRKAVCFTAVVLSLALLYFLNLPPGAVALEPGGEPQDDIRASRDNRLASPPTAEKSNENRLVSKGGDIIVGVDIYAGMYKYSAVPDPYSNPPTYNGIKELKYWVDDVKDAGMNYIRLIVPGNNWWDCWESGGKISPDRSLFVYNYSEGKYKSSDGKLKVNETSGSCWASFVEGVSEAYSKEVILQVDLLDNVFFGNDAATLQRFDRSEYKGRNNVYGYIPDYGPDDELNDKLYHGRDHLWDTLLSITLNNDNDIHYHSADMHANFGSDVFALHEKIKNAFVNEKGGADFYHIIGDGNEIDEAPGTYGSFVVHNYDISKAVLTSSALSSYAGPKAVGHAKLWGAAEDSTLFDDVDYLCVHGPENFSRTTYLGRYEKLNDHIVNTTPNGPNNEHLKIFFSTDGCTGTRPTKDQLRQMYYDLVTEQHFNGSVPSAGGSRWVPFWRVAGLELFGREMAVAGASSGLRLRVPFELGEMDIIVSEEVR